MGVMDPMIRETVLVCQYTYIYTMDLPLRISQKENTNIIDAVIILGRTERTPSGLMGVMEPMASDAAPISTTSSGSLSPKAPPTASSPLTVGSSQLQKKKNGKGFKRCPVR